MKAKVIRDSEGLFYGIKWICPGCASSGRIGTHVLPVSWLPPGETQESPHNAGKPHWSFNGDMERPIFGPSVLSQWYEGPERINKVCHSFVGCNGAQPGQIIFLGDSTHPLANQTVDLPEIDP